MADVIRVAHRGASGVYPENTQLALEKALEARVDMIEVDCQLTKDGHVIVFHDEDLKRTARARGSVKVKTLQELKKLDIGAWRKKAFKGQKILTLEEVLKIVNGKADLCLEIKQYRGSPLGIELKMLFILSHYDYLERTVFSSFDYHCLSRVRELAPDVRLGLIYGKGTKEDPIVAAGELAARSVHVQRDLVSHELVNRVRAAGLDLYAWTVNEVAEMEKFISWGVKGIVSDYPEKFWKLRLRRK